MTRYPYLQAAPKQLVALHPKQKVSVTLIEREELTHNTRRFRFALPSPEHKLGLPVGKHLFISGMWKGDFVMRAYTPVTGMQVCVFEHPDCFHAYS